MGDWDLFLRLTAEREPLTLPAIACFYFTDAENRTPTSPRRMRADGADDRGPSAKARGLGMSANRVLVLGLDSFDPTLAAELAAAGRLPAISQLMREGAAAQTQQPVRPLRRRALADSGDGPFGREGRLPQLARRRPGDLRAAHEPL